MPKEQVGRQQNRDLSCFHPNIEGDQGRQELAPGQAQFLQNAGKAHTVEQPKTEYQGDAPGLQGSSHEILDGHVGDREGDRRFHYSGWQRNRPQHGQPQGDGMGHGERSSLGQQGTPLEAQQEQPEHEEDMVQTVGEDVSEIQDEILAHEGEAGTRHCRG